MIKKCAHCGTNIECAPGQIKVICPECGVKNVDCVICGQLEDIVSAYLSGEHFICRTCIRAYDDDIDIEYVQGVLDHDRKPCPVFLAARGEDPRKDPFIGVELEVDEGGQDDDVANEILDMSCSEIYVKRDGSLNDGLELVSQPATLDYHKNCMGWDNICRYLREQGYLSHDAGTCGLHVHINRRVFREVDEAKLVYFVEKFWHKLVEFSRRTEAQLNEWASRYGLTDGEHPEALLSRAKGTRSRYYAVNLSNDFTIELRLFRGTLRYTTLMATLEFVHVLVCFIKDTSVETIQGMTWQDFVDTIDPGEFPYLWKYLGERGLR